MPVHPTAVLDPGAEVDEAAEIGPYCVLGPGVVVGARTRLIAHVVIDGDTRLGCDNVVFPFTTIGVAPQDLKYQGEPSRTRIGDRNRIRESVTIHRGTAGGGMETTLGDDNLLMAYTHIAHDVQIGNHCILSHAATIGGHVQIGDWAVVGAATGIHQFCRIGRHAMIGGYSVITQDVLPFATTVSERKNRVFGANRVGLERRGFTAAQIEPLQTALRLLTRAGLNTTQALERIQEELPQTPELAELIAFIRSSERGFIK